MIINNIFFLQIRELSRQKLFGRPGHGAPTENIRKKKFTEYQLFDENAKRRDDNPMEVG